MGACSLCMVCLGHKCQTASEPKHSKNAKITQMYKKAKVRTKLLTNTLTTAKPIVNILLYTKQQHFVI